MAGDAELVFAGGGVWTLDPARPWASAVAVRGGRIALVGSTAEAHELRGPRTQVIDLRGRANAVASGGEPFLPEQRVDLETAIAGYTRSAAFLNRLDAETGSIEVGKLADLVVLDRNLFEQPAGEIADARVLLTMVEGQPVHQAPAL